MDSTVSLHMSKTKLSERKMVMLQKHVMRHEEEFKGAKHRNKNIDRSRTHLNETLMGDASKSYRETVEEWYAERSPRTKTGKLRKIHKDAVGLCEFTVQLGGDASSGITDAEQAALLRWCHEWLVREWGAKNVLGSAIHMDETNPHLHFDIAPFTDEGRLSARDIMTPERLSDVQARFLNDLQEEYPDMGFRRLRANERTIPRGMTQEHFQRARDLARLEAKDEKREVLAHFDQLQEAGESYLNDLQKREVTLDEREKALKEYEEKLDERDRAWKKWSETINRKEQDANRFWWRAQEEVKKADKTLFEAKNLKREADGIIDKFSERVGALEQTASQDRKTMSLQQAWQKLQPYIKQWFQPSGYESITRVVTSRMQPLIERMEERKQTVTAAKQAVTQFKHAGKQKDDGLDFDF